MQKYERKLINGKYVDLPIERPIEYRMGSLRFGYTVEKDGIYDKFIPNKKHIYRCYYSKLTDEGLEGCDFTGSWDVVKEHMNSRICCRGEEE